RPADRSGQRSLPSRNTCSRPARANPRDCATRDARPSSSAIPAGSLGSPLAKVVWIAGELLDAARRDQKVVLDTQSAAALPVGTGLDGQHHALLDRPAAGLMRVRRLVRTGPDAVRDRVRRLVEPRVGDARPDDAIELGEACARTA